MRWRLAAFQEREPNVEVRIYCARAPRNPFGRLFATIDRLLLVYAEMMIRNGDIPRCMV